MEKTKNRFLTQFTAVGQHFYAPHGEKIQMEHNPKMHENGRRELIRDKKVAIYDLIQSHKEECEIENIIRRAVEGDYSILQKRHGQYMDITGMPSSIAEAQQFIMDMKEEFNRLPKEIKAKFEYNPELYVAEMGQDIKSWLEKTGLAEKYKLEEEAKEASKLFEGNLQKAVENLATGNTVNNAGGENNE